jgi:hypothetical protein
MYEKGKKEKARAVPELHRPGNTGSARDDNQGFIDNFRAKVKAGL